MNCVAPRLRALAPLLAGLLLVLSGAASAKDEGKTEIPVCYRS